jgi:PAS domain S-box-containing protein
MVLRDRFTSTQLTIVLAFLAMLILAFISFFKISGMNEMSTQVNHSNLIQLSLQETYSDLSDADSELSKHILTSDISYRRKMVEYENKIRKSIQKIKSLATTNVRQTNRVVALDSLIQMRFKLMSEALQADNKDYKLIASKISDCNARIVSIIGEMKDAEREGLTELESSMEGYKLWTPVIIFSLEIFVILFLFYLYLRSERELKNRIHLQHELERQVTFIRAILDNSVDIILVLDPESNLVVANKKAADLLGITDEMVGKNIYSLFPLAQNSISQDAISQALKGEFVHLEKHKPKSIDRTVESFFIPLLTGDEVSAVIILLHDISALVRTSDELEITIEKLRKINLDLEQFAYVASHDLQEPLRKIMTYTDLAGRSITDSEKLSSYLSKISRSAARMSNLIVDVLKLSRVSSQSVENEPVDLSAVVKQVIQDLELLIDEKQAIINVAVLPTVQGHAMQLSQVFANLIQNALKFCDKQPVVTIACEVNNGFYVLSVGDNGIGFDQIHKDQIFEVFKRIPNKQDYSGTGIGLAVCKKIIDNHGGSITVESEVGKGTTFIIQLPAPPSQQADLEAEPTVAINIPTKIQN